MIIVLGIAGNKSDLYSKEEVSEQNAQTFANQHEMVFKLVSAKKNSQIDDLFLMTAEKFHKEVKDVDENQTVTLICEEKIKKEDNNPQKNVCC